MSVSNSLWVWGEVVADGMGEVAILLVSSTVLSAGEALYSSIGVSRCLESCRAPEMVLGIFGLDGRTG